MKKKTKGFKIKVGKHLMKVAIRVNKDGNLEITFSDKDLNKMPNGFCYEGYNNELIIYPFNP